MCLNSCSSVKRCRVIGSLRLSAITQVWPSQKLTPEVGSSRTSTRTRGSSVTTSFGTLGCSTPVSSRRRVAWSSAIRSASEKRRGRSGNMARRDASTLRVSLILIFGMVVPPFGYLLLVFVVDRSAPVPLRQDFDEPLDLRQL